MASFSTTVPARLDRLPWSRFHWLVVVALGATWILDGLEVTLVGSLSGAIQDSPALHMDAAAIGLAGSVYIAGAVLGALFFGYLTDRLGRKMLFTVTVGVYLVATVLTGLSWSFWSFALFRFAHGHGHRRRIFRDQFGDPGIHSGPPPRLHRSRHQWQLLDRGGHRRAGLRRRARSRAVSAGLWLALRLYHRRAARASDHLFPPFPARKPALADDAWPSGGSCRHRRRNRSHGGRGEGRHLGRRRSDCDPAQSWPSPDSGQRGANPVRTLSVPGRSRRHADGDPGLLLQRHLLHLCADPDVVLRRCLRRCRLVYPAIRAGQFRGAVAARPFLRQHRPQTDDRRHLCASPACS